MTSNTAVNANVCNGSCAAGRCGGELPLADDVIVVIRDDAAKPLLEAFEDLNNEVVSLMMATAEIGLNTHFAIGRANNVQVGHNVVTLILEQPRLSPSGQHRG